MAVDTTTALSGLEAARAKIAGVIKGAADATGASFGYLVAAAKMESNLNPSAAASTSSARGLYQFIEQTWLGTVKEAGASFGYGAYADAIQKTSSGRYTVSDPAMRREILKLRDDPAANAAMAGVLTQSNSFKLTGTIGRRPSDGELYIAHFLGVGGAGRLINASESSPRSSAVQMFPAAAAANRSIFYTEAGQPRSVSQVYATLTGRYDAAADSRTTRNAIAAVGGASALGAVATSFVPETAAYLSALPNAITGGASKATAAADASSARQVAAADTRLGYTSLYQVGERSDAISPLVQSLWATGRDVAVTADAAGSSAVTPATTAALAAPPLESTFKRVTPLDLFSDRKGTFAG